MSRQGPRRNSGGGSDKGAQGSRGRAGPSPLGRWQPGILARSQGAIAGHPTDRRARPARRRARRPSDRGSPGGARDADRRSAQGPRDLDQRRTGGRCRGRRHRDDRQRPDRVPVVYVAARGDWRRRRAARRHRACSRLAAELPEADLGDLLRRRRIDSSVPRRRRRGHRSGQPRRDRAQLRWSRRDGRPAAAAPSGARHADRREGCGGRRRVRADRVVPGLPAVLKQMQGSTGSGSSDSTTPPTPICSNSAISPPSRSVSSSGPRVPGLSRLVRERCDPVVSIPMLGGVSSLNVSAAAALSTYEISRHRGSPAR